MTIDDQCQLAKDGKAANMWTSTVIPPALRQLWGMGLQVPPLFMWPTWALVVFSIAYFDVGFTVIWFIGKSMAPFFQQPTAQVLPVFCVAFGLGGLFNALHQKRIRKKMAEVNQRYK